MAGTLYYMPTVEKIDEINPGSVNFECAYDGGTLILLE